MSGMKKFVALFLFVVARGGGRCRILCQPRRRSCRHGLHRNGRAHGVGSGHQQRAYQ